VLEMGMSGLGEIALLASLALPSIGVITNIGEAHIALLGSRDNIARAKNELLVSMGTNGRAFLNGDDPYLQKMGESFPGASFYYGFDETADLRAVSYHSSENGLEFSVRAAGDQTQEFWLPYFGKHNVYNALAAIAVGLHLGVEYEDIRRGLAEAKFSAMRMEIKESGRGVRIINDAYNASPFSMKAALQALMDQAGGKKTMAVLGDMLELGEFARDSHLDVGRYLSGLSPDYLVTVGENAALIARGASEAGLPENRIFAAEDSREAIMHLRSLELQGYCLLLKGSRRMRLEQIAEELLKL